MERYEIYIEMSKFDEGRANAVLDLAWGNRTDCSLKGVQEIHNKEVSDLKAFVGGPARITVIVEPIITVVAD